MLALYACPGILLGMKRTCLAVVAAACLIGATAASVSASTPAPAPGKVSVHLLRPAKAPSGAPRTALPRPARAGNAAVTSGNWSGYAATACGSCHLRYVQAQFNMASVNCTATPDAFVSHWAGLDGLFTGTVEQTGVLAYCSGGAPGYLAWYEMYPDPPVYFTGDIAPGDAFAAAVYFNQGTGRWQLGLTDVTTGASLATAQACPAGASCQDRSAEVITEAPSDASGVLPLADFGVENYTGAAVTSYNGTRGTLASQAGVWTQNSVTMAGASGVLAVPSGLQGGQAFSVAWHAAS